MTMNRLFSSAAIVALLSACSGGGSSPVPAPVPVQPVITDLSSYLVQYTCNGKPFNACNDPQPQTSNQTVYFRRFDIGKYQASEDALNPDGSVTQTFSFPPFGAFNAANGDGGDLVEQDGTTARIVETEDGGTPGIQYFVGPLCGGTGWLLFTNMTPQAPRWQSAVATLNDVGNPALCPSLHNAYTQFTTASVSYKFWFDGAEQDISLPTIISEHYDSAEISTSHNMERFYYTRNAVGKTRWEHWTDRPALVPSDLAQRCPSVSLSTPPAAGWTITDCRQWTVIQTDAQGWSVSQFGWP